MKAKKKTNAKTYALQRRKRRQWLTFVRMVRYGVNNFSRNAWLTVAATAMMTLTLLVIFISVSSRNILMDSVAQIRDSVDMSIYVVTDTPEEEVEKMKSDLKKLEGVNDVAYVTPQEARDTYREENRDNERALEALNIAEVEFPGRFRVAMEDINETESLDKYIKEDERYLEYADTEREPSFEGDRRVAIENIGRWVGFAEKLGLVISAVLVVISSLIVFNTIRMAIFNRKEEIHMMKLIGADKSFIRGPFLVEAIVYGVVAAVLATGLGVLMVHLASDTLEAYGIVVSNTLQFIFVYGGYVLLGMVLLGSLIGVLSSLFATYKHLKI